MCFFFKHCLCPVTASLPTATVCDSQKQLSHFTLLLQNERKSRFSFLSKKQVDSAFISHHIFRSSFSVWPHQSSQQSSERTLQLCLTASNKSVKPCHLVLLQGRRLQQSDAAQRHLLAERPHRLWSVLLVWIIVAVLS